MTPTSSKIISTRSRGKKLTWPVSSQLVGVTLSLQPKQEAKLSPQYPVALHAWLLNQVSQDDRKLSRQMHDDQAEKSFSMSRFQGFSRSGAEALYVSSEDTYDWQVNGFSRPVVQWMQAWLRRLPTTLKLYESTFKIEGAQVTLPAMTYKKLWNCELLEERSLHFLTPTSFRRNGNHVPLPNPTSLFHSYLRRWNQFSGLFFEPEPFLEWVAAGVVIRQHELSSARVSGGKRGLVTGFLGTVELGLVPTARKEKDYVRLFNALCDYAPYCGTGHKTTFGLGHTGLGWEDHWLEEMPAIAELTLGDRIEELTEYFVAFHQERSIRQTLEVSEKWAQVMARREIGDSLYEIAEDMDAPYETIKTYSKLARRALREEG